MNGSASGRATKTASKRRIIAVPTDVAPPPSEPEVTLEAFRQLIVELTGRQVERPIVALPSRSSRR